MKRTRSIAIALAAAMVTAEATGHAQAIDTLAAPDVTASPSASPSPGTETPASSSPAPDANANASSSPPSSASPETSSSGPPARRRRARRHRRTVASEQPPPARRRARRPRRVRARSPMIVFAARYMDIPTEGARGPTWGFTFEGHPLAGRRDAGRYVRFGLGAEVAVRSASHGRTDPILWAVLDLGFQYPTRYIVPFVAAVLHAGIAERYRFEQPSLESAWQLGIEGGAAVRPDSFLGLEIAAGVGRTQIGSQWSVNAWIRFGVAFF